MTLDVAFRLLLETALIRHAVNVPPAESLGNATLEYTTFRLKL